MEWKTFIEASCINNKKFIAGATFEGLCVLFFSREYKKM